LYYNTFYDYDVSRDCIVMQSISRFCDLDVTLKREGRAAMPPVKMSASWVHAVQAPPQGQLDYRDTHPAGLILRVSATGVKSWCILYRYQGRQQRYTFGQYPVIGLAEARQYAVHARHTLMLGQDPRATVQQAAAMPLVADVATWARPRGRPRLGILAA
jgi:hypothetical protein